MLRFNVDLPLNICNHTFRGKGITTFFKNGGTLEKAQAIAAHSSSRTTKLHDQCGDDLSINDIELVVI